MSVIKKDKNTYYFEFILNGDRHRHYTWKGQKMTTKAFAKQCETECRNELFNITNEEQIPHLYELYEDWIENTKKSYKQSTLGMYNKFKNNYLTLIPNKEITKLTIKDISEFKNKILDTPNSVAYKKRWLGVMLKLLDYAMQVYDISGKLKTPLLEDIKDNTIKEFTTKEKWLKEAEFSAMLSHLDYTNKDDYYWIVVLTVLYNTGLRIGEACALTVSDYDAKNKCLLINKDYVRVGGTDYIQPPKSELGRRRVFLDDTTSLLISNYIDAYKPKNSLFHKDAEYLNQQKLRRVLHRLAKAEGLEESHEIKVHNLRKSHASNLLALGFSEYDIAKRLGHEPKMSATVYIQADESNQLKIAQMLNK